MERIINVVLAQMAELTNEQLQKLDAVLHHVLSEYDFKPRETGVVVQSTEWMEMLNIFLARKTTDGKSVRTIALYKDQLTHLLSYLNKPVKDITENDLFSYLAMYKQVRKVSNRYLDDIRRIMTSFFGWLHRKDFIAKDPSAGLDPIKCEQVIKKPFSDEELELLRTNCDNEREIALVDFLYSTGVRVSELVALNKDDVNLDTLEVIVKGKGNKERQTYLTRTARLHLKKYLETRDDDCEALFVSKRAPHQRMTVTGIQNTLRAIGEKSGVKNTHPHRFRRTMATNVLKKGMPLEEVRTLLGHVKLETTMIYCTVSQENVRRSHAKCMCA